MKDTSLSISITTGTIGKVLIMLLGIWLLYELFDVVLVILTAIVVASAIEPAARWFIARKVPRALAVLIVFATFLLSVFGVVYIFVPVFLVQAAVFIAAIPSYFEFLNHLAGDYSPILNAAGLDPIESVASLVETSRAMVQEFTGNAFVTASTVFGGVLSAILILVFSFYFAMQERGIEDFLRVVTPLQHEEYVIDLWKRSRHKIGLWLQGQLLLGVIVGVLVYLSLTILGIQHAFVLAVLAAMFELIPVFGPTLSAIPAVIIGFVDGGVALGLLVVALYVIIQQFENHLIYPLVVTKVVGVPPLLVILGILIGGKIAGFLGILLSAPIAAVIQEVVSDIEGRRRKEMRTQGHS